MKFRRWMTAVAVGVAGAAAACSEAPQQAGNVGTDRSTPAAESSVAADTNIVFVDVRTDDEYRSGHIEGAIHIPHTEMAERYEELEAYEDKQIVLYCQSGRRSGIAERVLEERGFDNVINGGGLGDLRAQGFPTTSNCC